MNILQVGRGGWWWEWGGGVGGGILGNTLCEAILESHRDNINSWQVLFYILCNIYCN